MGPAHERRERPGNRDENDQQRNAKPDGDCFKFFCVRAFALCFCRANSNYANGNKHHQAVFHSKKANFAQMHRRGIVVQKVVNDGADQVKPKADEQLNMSNGSGPVSQRIIEWRKNESGAPGAVCANDGDHQTEQHEPAHQRMQR